MYGRLVRFTIGPGTRDVATATADEALKKSRDLDGFVSATYMILDEEKGEYGSLTVWESRDKAEAAAEVLRPWMMQALGDRFQGQPDIRLVEIYEPK